MSHIVLQFVHRFAPNLNLLIVVSTFENLLSEINEMIHIKTHFSQHVTNYHPMNYITHDLDITIDILIRMINAELKLKTN